MAKTIYRDNTATITISNLKKEDGTAFSLTGFDQAFWSARLKDDDPTALISHQTNPPGDGKVVIDQANQLIKVAIIKADTQSMTEDTVLITDCLVLNSTTQESHTVGRQSFNLLMNIARSS